MWKLMLVGLSSGSGTSLLRNCSTCRMLGLAFTKGCEHMSPNSSTRHATLTMKSPWRFASTVSASVPPRQCSSTQSTSIIWLPIASWKIGLLPQVTSRMNVPKAKTSVRGVALLVRASSGAR
ncbi:hypothetical protein PVAP13_4NG161824 [Panicum virgatum]|uniref:Uncharacterized protein n=1 Tax=Panicum virgatum TaxID=38727 RepID=A0A8T0T9G8_PANVG|nr:hypothetical protein PVAP13_4NG161824 [Panicum virgatum]